jgi:hypothetical protein
MLNIGQPVKHNDGSFYIYLGVVFGTLNPNGETMVMDKEGNIKSIDSFDAPMTVRSRNWMYSHIEDADGKLVDGIYSVNLGFFGCIESFEGHEELKKEILDRLLEVIEFIERS